MLKRPSKLLFLGVIAVFVALTNSTAFAYLNFSIDDEAYKNQIFGNIMDQSRFDAIGQQMLDEGEADITKLQEDLLMSQMGGVLSDIQSIQQSFRINANPAFPNPNQSVTISIDDYSINSVGAAISWSINGEVVPTLQNNRSIETTAPAVGETKTITASLRLPNGATISASSILKPIQIDVVIEAETQVPSGYLGRSMPVQRTPITATALVYDGTSVDTSTYSYRWSVDRSVANGGAVRGQFRFTFTPPLRRSVPVMVEVYNAQGTQIGRTTTDVPLVEPKILFYEQNPLRGSSALALPKNITISGTEMTIQAKPFYFSNKVATNDLVYVWKVNNKMVAPDEQNQGQITIQPPNSSGNGVVELQLRNPQEILQRITSNLRVTY